MGAGDALDRSGEIAAGAVAGIGLIARLWNRMRGRDCAAARSRWRTSHQDIVLAIDGMRAELRAEIEGVRRDLSEWKSEVRQSLRQVHERLLTQERR